MNCVRIAALLEPFLDAPLAPAALEQISTYIDLLRRWNARINLTAIRGPEEIVTRHFGESFFLARHLFPRSGAGETTSRDAASQTGSSSTWPSPTSNSAHYSDQQSYLAPNSPVPAARVLDIGSGAGFPALPLKIWVPAIHLTLVESNHKKAAFLREVARALTLTDVNVLTHRAEVVARRAPGSADVVTFRAVERFERILAEAIRLLPPEARLALLIGSSQFPTLQSLTPSLTWAPPFPIPNSRARLVVIGIRQ